ALVAVQRGLRPPGALGVAAREQEKTWGEHLGEWAAAPPSERDRHRRGGPENADPCGQRGLENHGEANDAGEQRDRLPRPESEQQPRPGLITEAIGAGVVAHS